MSSNVCDCDRKTSNGGTCDSSCEEEVFSFVKNNSSPVSFAPILAPTKVSVVESISLTTNGEQCYF